MAGPSNRAFIGVMSSLHKLAYGMTGGIIGGQFGKAPILLLRTTGRKSGRERTTPLLYYRDGDNMVVIASNGGADYHPGWYVNLKANPNAKVQVGRATATVTGETASAEDRARLWPLITEMYSDYAEYEKRTKRQIPVVILRHSG